MKPKIIKLKSGNYICEVIGDEPEEGSEDWHDWASSGFGSTAEKAFTSWLEDHAWQIDCEGNK